MASNYFEKSFFFEEESSIKLCFPIEILNSPSEELPPPSIPQKTQTVNFLIYKNNVYILFILDATSLL